MGRSFVRRSLVAPRNQSGKVTNIGRNELESTSKFLASNPSPSKLPTAVHLVERPERSVLFPTVARRRATLGPERLLRSFLWGLR